MAEAYCEAVRRYGSDVMMGTRVHRVIVEDGKVAGIETDKGQFKAPIVISNAGLQPTVLKLLGEEYFDQDFTTRVRELVPSYSLIGYRYFLNKPVTDAPFGVVFSNDSPWTQRRLDEADAGKGSREGVLYFEVPANYDPNAAPEGKQMLMTGCFLPAGPKPFERGAPGLGECWRRSTVWRVPRARGCDREQGLLYDTQRVQREPAIRYWRGWAEKPSASPRLSASAGRRNHQLRHRSRVSSLWVRMLAALA